MSCCAAFALLLHVRSRCCSSPSWDVLHATLPNCIVCVMSVLLLITGPERGNAKGDPTILACLSCSQCKTWQTVWPFVRTQVCVESLCCTLFVTFCAITNFGYLKEVVAQKVTNKPLKHHLLLTPLLWFPFPGPSNWVLAIREFRRARTLHVFCAMIVEVLRIIAEICQDCSFHMKNGQQALRRFAETTKSAQESRRQISKSWLTKCPTCYLRSSSLCRLII